MEYNINIVGKESYVNQRSINNNQKEMKEEIKEININEIGNIDNLMSNQSIDTIQHGKEIFQILSKIIKEKKIDLFSLLSNCDTDEDGFLEKSELKFGLNKINQLNQNDFDSLLQFCNLKEKININEFVNKFKQNDDNN